MIMPLKPVEPIYRMLGMKVEQLRTMLGWTQQELADKLHRSRGSIANFEAGRERILLHDLEAIAAAFSSSPKAMLRGIWT